MYEAMVELIVRKHVERIVRRVEVLAGTVSFVAWAWLLDSGHPVLGWSLAVSNMITMGAIIYRESRS